jgi:hypothetical protein
MEFSNSIGTNVHGIEVMALDNELFMSKNLPASEYCTMLLSTEDKTFEDLMNYLNIKNLVGFDQFGEDFLWQMYHKGDAYVHYFFTKDGTSEREYFLRLRDGKTIVHDAYGDIIKVSDQILDSPAKVEAYFFKADLASSK